MQTGRGSSAGTGGEGCPCIPWLGTGKKPCCGVPHPGSEPPGAAGAPPSPPHPAAGVTALSHVPRGFIQANLHNGALLGQSTSRHTEPASCSRGDGSSGTTNASVSREHPLGTPTSPQPPPGSRAGPKERGYKGVCSCLSTQVVSPSLSMKQLEAAQPCAPSSPAPGQRVPVLSSGAKPQHTALLFCRSWQQGPSTHRCPPDLFP